MGHGGKDAPAFSDRFLEQACVSSVAYIMLFVRWAFCKPQLGGLQTEASVASSREVLEAIIQCSCKHADGKHFDIRFAQDWACAWPRPTASAAVASLSVPVTECGHVHLGKLLGLEDGLGSNVVAKNWHKWIFVPTDHINGGAIDLMSLFERIAPQRRLRPFLAQVCMGLATHIESALAVSRALDVPARLLAFREKTIRHDAPDLDLLLFNYVSASVRHSLSWNCIGIATDKARPCSGSFANTVFSFPDNKLVIACPQVRTSL